jgi:hypothetical protein
MIDFELASDITEVEIIAVGRAIREFSELQQRFGKGRWRKLKGIATITLRGGMRRRAEIHWYEAHGIGKKRIKIKRYLD